jgi:hypothetical protein
VFVTIEWSLSLGRSCTRDWHHDCLFSAVYHRTGVAFCVFRRVRREKAVPVGSGDARHWRDLAAGVSLAADTAILGALQVVRRRQAAEAQRQHC